MTLSDSLKLFFFFFFFFSFFSFFFFFFLLHFQRSLIHRDTYVQFAIVYYWSCRFLGNHCQVSQASMWLKLAPYHWTATIFYRVHLAWLDSQRYNYSGSVHSRYLFFDNTLQDNLHWVPRIDAADRVLDIRAICSYYATMIKYRSTQLTSLLWTTRGSRPYLALPSLLHALPIYLSSSLLNAILTTVYPPRRRSGSIVVRGKWQY